MAKVTLCETENGKAPFAEWFDSLGAKVMLRDYINATVGFESVGKAVEKDPKSLMRMLSSRGNPNVKNLFSVTQFLQKKAGVQFRVVASKKKKVAKQKLVH